MSRIVLPALAHEGSTSIDAMWRSGPAAVVTASRNAVTWGLRTRLAIVRPAAVYGMTTRSAPASLSFFSASSSDARATIWMFGRTERAESVMYRLSASSSEAITMPSARSSPARRRSSSSVASPSIRRSPCSCALATASWLKSSTTYDTPAARNSSATWRPTRPYPQMMKWSRRRSIVLSLRRSARTPVKTPPAIASTITAPA